jgi:MoxR-like ATPase
MCIQTNGKKTMEFTIESIKKSLAEQKYIANDELAAAIFVALALDRPLLIEGAAGVGKTEVAKAMTAVLDRDLVRLQCHIGIDETRALCEWNYQKQLLAIQASTGIGNQDTEEIVGSVFSEEFLLERPLLQSIKSETPVVLLIDELDKTDEEFEAFLLELLAEYQVTIPELGTIKATTKPFTVLTSNNSRQLSDALRRRCAYVRLEYPSIAMEIEIIQARHPNAESQLVEDVANAVAALRSMQRIIKKPSIAESLDWLAALEALGVSHVDQHSAEATVSALLKSQTDIEEAFENDVFDNPTEQASKIIETSKKPAQPSTPEVQPITPTNRVDLSID